MVPVLRKKLFELFSRMSNKKPLLTTYSVRVLKSNSNFSNQKAVNELGLTLRPFDETIADIVNFNYSLILVKKKFKLRPAIKNGHPKT